MDEKLQLLLIFSVAALFIALFSPVSAEPVSDKQALLDFLHGLTHPSTLNWNESSPSCTSWRGVTCNGDRTRVIALRLPGSGLRGVIPPNTLSRLSAIRTISLRSNALSGPFPPDLSDLKYLTHLYLQFNKFSGPLPLNYSVLKNLTVVDLSNNAFNGTIPSSISNLTLLTSLDLSNNYFSGEITDLSPPSLKHLNLANNKLSGVVPKSLQRFPSWAFSGNNLTLPNAPPPIQPPVAQPTNKKTIVLDESAILGIIICGSALIFVVIGVGMFVCSTKSEKEDRPQGQSRKKKADAPTKKAYSERQLEGKNGQLVFFEGCNFAFDLEDLLRASAEVLGKGSFGMTYKAALEDSTTVVVKRLKEVTTGKREFEQHMEAVGRIRHENVAAVRAYYYSKDEKLVVYDYYEQGSVSVMLHGKGGEGRNTTLDWDTRLRVAVGAARGIAHIHTQQGGKLVHGNVKASNIFFNSQGYGCVSDTSLAILMNPIPQPVSQTAGYRAPEVTDIRKATHASDVYSYGVFLLELLTGKSPLQARGGEGAVHLVRWVNSVVREEWTAEVFDVELFKYPSIEEEMVELLQIGMTCVARTPEKRPKMSDVARMVEEIRRGNTGNRPSSESKSQVSTPTPHATEIVSSPVSQ